MIHKGATMKQILPTLLALTSVSWGTGLEQGLSQIQPSYRGSDILNLGIRGTPAQRIFESMPERASLQQHFLVKVNSHWVCSYTKVGGENYFCEIQIKNGRIKEN